MLRDCGRLPNFWERAQSRSIWFTCAYVRMIAYARLKSGRTGVRRLCRCSIHSFGSSLGTILPHPPALVMRGHKTLILRTTILAVVPASSVTVCGRQAALLESCVVAVAPAQNLRSVVARRSVRQHITACGKIYGRVVVLVPASFVAFCGRQAPICINFGLPWFPRCVCGLWSPGSRTHH